MNLSRVLALTAVYSAGVGAAAQLSKLVPLLETVQVWYGVGLPAATLLFSAIGIAGACLGMAAGEVVGRVGLVRATAAASAVGLVAALVLPAMPHYESFVALRIVESASHLVVVTAAPGLMARLAPERLRSVVLAVWATFFGVAFVGSQALAQTGLALASPVLFLWLHGLLFAPMPLALALGPLRKAVRAESAPPDRPRTRPALRDLVPTRLDAGLFAAFSFACHSGTTTALLTFAPIELRERWGMTAAGAAGLATLLPIVALVATFATSPLVRPGRAAPIVIGGALAMVCALVLLLVVDPAQAPAVFLAIFAAFGIVQAAIFGRIVELAATPEGVARMNGLYTQIGNAGIIVSAPIVAAAYPLLEARTMPVVLGLSTLCIALFQVASVRTGRRRSAVRTS